jgi:hypothetical protein
MGALKTIRLYLSRGDIMGIKEQLGRIKDNWLIILLGLILVIVLFGGTNLIGSLSNTMYSKSIGGAYDYGVYADSSGASRESYAPSPSYTQSSDFAPEVTTRMITKTSYLTSDIERGRFQDARNRLADIVKMSSAYLLSENVNRYGNDKHPYYVGSYQLKVDATKYDEVVSELKLLGEVTSFKESQTDITGSYTNLQIELDAEKARLARYQAMLDDATITADKITLSDKIYDQERRVKYLQDSIEKMDQRVDYSTVYLTLKEKQNEYADLAIAKFSALVHTLVGSFNALLYLLFAVLPWAIVIGIIALIMRLVKARADR